MAGIAGMGTPARVAPDVPQAPPVQAAQLPPMQGAPQQAPQQQEIDYDALAQASHAEANTPAPQAQAQPASQDIDYDALAHSVHNQQIGKAPEEPQQGDTSYLGALARVVTGGAGATSDADKKKLLGPVAKTASWINKEVVDRAGFAEIRGAVNAGIDKSRGDEGASILSGALTGLLDPSAVPTNKQLTEKVAPSTAKQYSPLRSDTLDSIAKTMLTEAEFKKYKDTADNFKMSPSDAIGFGADVASGLVVGGALKSVGKLTGLVGGAAVELAEDAKAPMKAIEVAGNLDPVRKAEVSAQSLDEFAQKLEAAKAKIPLMPNQADLTNAAEQQVAASISNNAAIQAVKRKQGEMATQAILDQANSFANIEPKAGGAKGAFDTLHEAADAQGRIIRANRDLAKEAAGEGALPIASLQSKMKEYTDLAGFSRVGDKLVVPSAEDMAVNLNINPDDAKRILPFLQRYSERVYNSGGRMKFGDLEQFYQKDLTLFAKQLESTNSTARHIAYDLRGAAGDDMTTNIGTLLKDSNPTAAAKYEASMDAYHRTKLANDKIKTILNRDDITADNMANFLINKGPGGADSANAVTEILARDNPEGLKDLRGAAVNKVFYDNKNVPTVKNPLPYDFKGIKNDIDKIAGTDGKMLDTLTGSPENSKMLRELVDRAAQMHEGLIADKPVINESAVGRLMYLASKINAPKELIGTLFKLPGRNANIQRYVDAVGMQNMLKYSPPSFRPSMLNYMRSTFNSLSQDNEKELPQGYQKQGQ